MTSEYLRGAVEATRMLLLEEKAAVERDLAQARGQIRDLESRLASTRVRLHEAEDRLREPAEPAVPAPGSEPNGRDERLCLTHQVQRWVCAPLQGPDEFCVSVVPCQGCGDAGAHYHTSDGQSHDGSPP